MLGTKKKFDSNLDKWAKAAEHIIRQHLKAIGYQVTHLPHGKYGKDHVCENDIERFFVEVERRSSNAWKEGEFPFRSLHVPERRQIDKSTLLFVVRSDLEKYLVVFPSDIEEAELEEVPNRFVRKNEFFKNIPLCRCLPVECNDTEQVSLAERNRRRVRACCQSMSLDTGLSMLGSVPPYGMTDQEWRELYDEVTRKLGEALFGDGQIFDRPWEDPTWKDR